MKALKKYWLVCISVALFFFAVSGMVFADDTCMFMVTSNEVGPNIVFLLDNGAEMEQITWHSGYNNNTDYTPLVSPVPACDVVKAGGSVEPLQSYTTLILTNVDETDYPFATGTGIEGVTSGATANVVSKTYIGPELHLKIDSVTGTFQAGEIVRRYKNKNSIATGTLSQIIIPPTPPPVSGTCPVGGNGFFNENGYAAVNHGGIWCLVKILDDLNPDSYTNGLDRDLLSVNKWTINGKTITLPVAPSTTTVTDPDTGLLIKDNATIFRYSKNYMNWLFFGPYSVATHGALPAKSRFYYAKQALLSVGKITSNKADFGIYSFTSTTEGASNVQPLGEVVTTVVEGNPNANILNSNYVNNINNLGTVNYSPLAEGLATIGGYYNSSSSGVAPANYCQDQYVIVVSSGISSKDQTGASQYRPTILSDYDEDGAAGMIGEGYVKADNSIFAIPQNIEGSTWLDDVAYYLYTHDMVGYVTGFQNVKTYTVGVMAGRESNLYLINTSNNGNGQKNLYDTTKSDYGKYHFTADSAGGLSAAILAAVNAILTQTSTFTAPVVPVTRTTSGNRIYLALFKPTGGNFWEGNVVKFGINDTLQIVDKNGDLATFPNGALKETAVSYWATKNWSDIEFSSPDCIGEGCNYIENVNRKIYTYSILGSNPDLTHSSNEFKSSNTTYLTTAVLGNPTSGRNTVIDFVRGADALDEDKDSNIDENRKIITGDVLHSEPAVFRYNYRDSTAETYVFFGSNGGMLHAVHDAHISTTGSVDTEINYGTEEWAFIPPDQLPRLKYMVEGFSHQFYVDSSPAIYFKDVGKDGFVDSGDQVILICGERKGGTSYFALDITDPVVPSYMWKIDRSVVAELGETWSEPVFGLVKTSDTDITGTPVMFVGGGYGSTLYYGKTVLAIDISNGTIVKRWTGNPLIPVSTIIPASAYIAGMTYSIPSSINALDEDDDGFVDKLYVGDLGGRIWRIGRFTDTTGMIPLVFPETDQNILRWNAQILFQADNSIYNKKFFYPVSLTLERGYDLLFAGTGDRENTCDKNTGPDSIYSIKDSHGSTTLYQTDLVNVTDTAATPPNLDSSTSDVDANSRIDKGWYINLGTGEKVLAGNTIFYKTLYITTFLPNDDPCLPGGAGYLYALKYKTGAAALFDVNNDSILERSLFLGGGIPSKPVMVISETGQKLFISIGSTTPGALSELTTAGIIAMDPLAALKNFFYIWWREIFN
ncbi:MAG: PilC/PilY family type IV pilus protein [Pseudomonadota bacterium]